MTENGYQPTKGKLDKSKPPKQGSGVPRLNHKSMESKELLKGDLPPTPKRPPNPSTKTFDGLNDVGNTSSFYLEGDKLEVIRRKVNKSGSGAHIYVPSEWLDETVVVIRTGE